MDALLERQNRALSLSFLALAVGSGCAISYKRGDALDCVTVRIPNLGSMVVTVAHEHVTALIDATEAGAVAALGAGRADREWLARAETFKILGVAAEHSAQ